MKLHQDKDSFKLLLEEVYERTGYRIDVLEKDYYVVLILKELASKQENGLPAYFKGGTALYKALKTTNRFSEDIDLSVETRGCSRTQNNKRLENATKKYDALVRDPSMGKTNRSEVVAVYKYDPISEFDANDVLQRFGFLKIEATSFTISEPTDSLEITPIIYDLATVEQKGVLESQYDVKPFKIKTIALERIFIDKLFAAESYVRKSNNPHRAFEAGKHIYDLVIMAHHPKIEALLKDPEKMKNLLNIRMTEEMDRLDGIPGIKPIEFIFFSSSEECNPVKTAYSKMQKQYVLQQQDRIEFDVACECLKEIETKLKKNISWANY